MEVLDGSAGAGAFRFRQPDDVFQLRVSLKDIEPPIWRRLLVPQNVLLPRLHRILQAAMGWKDYHLHQFLVGEVRFAEPDDEYLPGPIDYANIAFNQIAPRTGATCVYEYDFGDSWEHLIEVEEELPVESVTTPLPHCVAGARACPPEDAGGPPGYQRLLEALLRSLRRGAQRVPAMGEAPIRSRSLRGQGGESSPDALPGEGCRAGADSVDPAAYTVTSRIRLRLTA